MVVFPQYTDLLHSVWEALWPGYGSCNDDAQSKDIGDDICMFS